MNKKTGLWLLGCGLVSVAAGFMYLSLPSAIPKNSNSVVVRTPVFKQQLESAPLPLSIILPDAVSQHLSVSSLRGTQVDRADVVDAQGDFVLRPAILMYFDHFLSLRGEMSDDVIEQLILADIRRHYPAPIADQLTALFYRYRVYLIAISGRLAELSFFTALLQGVTQDSLEQEFQAEFFSEQEIDALFVAYKKMLSFRSAAKKFDTKYQRYQDVLQADPLQQEAILIQEFGIEAANRMMLLSDKRQRWQRRLKAYRAEKTLIMHSEHLDDYGKKEAVELLLQRSFDVSEQHRVEALNR